jgi:hypothetical protein
LEAGSRRLLLALEVGSFGVSLKRLFCIFLGLRGWESAPSSRLAHLYTTNAVRTALAYIEQYLTTAIIS